MAGRAGCGSRLGESYSPFHPQARSRSCICAGAGATTRTGSLFFEIGITDLAGMQMQPRFAEARAVAVDIVADDRPARRGRMHPQLMGAAGHRLHRKPGKAIAAAQHFPVGDGLLALRIGLLPPAALGVEAAERHVDGAFVLGGAALDHRPIGLGNLAMLEQQVRARRWPCGGGRAPGSRRYRCRADGPEPAVAAGRIAARRRKLPDWRRPWGRDAPAARPACRSPASSRRDGARGPGFLPRSVREHSQRSVETFVHRRETANTPPS